MRIQSQRGKQRKDCDGYKDIELLLLEKKTGTAASDGKKCHFSLANDSKVEADQQSLPRRHQMMPATLSEKDSTRFRDSAPITRI